ncbi:MAG: hypothetical protein ACHQ2Z_13605 [Elusimicrobiota bacterium]
MRPRSALLAALLAAPLSAAARGPAGSVEACLESAALQPRTVFEVVVGTYPTVVERRLDIKGINRMRRVEPPPKTIAHGLSIADFSLRYTTKSEATCWQPGGHTCAWLGSVVVDFTPKAIRIYIPKEYRPDSCESKELMLHEMEHERLHRQRVLETADKMRAALARAKTLPGPQTPINASTPDEAYSRLKLKVDDIVRPIYEEFLKKIEVEQEALDSQETYRRLGASCSGWKRT